MCEWPFSHFIVFLKNGEKSVGICIGRCTQPLLHCLVSRNRFQLHQHSCSHLPLAYGWFFSTPSHLCELHHFGYDSKKSFYPRFVKTEYIGLREIWKILACTTTLFELLDRRWGHKNVAAGCCGRSTLLLRKHEVEELPLKDMESTARNLLDANLCIVYTITRDGARN
jgi:hydroxyacyl-ACP dehydratase HTD2-like protein with hotdog domain